MGCGVLFPRDFECKSDSEGEGELMLRVVEDRAEVSAEAEEYETDSGDEDDWWRPEVKIGDKVQVGKHCQNESILSWCFARCISREMVKLSGRRMWCFPEEAFTLQWA